MSQGAEQHAVVLWCLVAGCATKFGSATAAAAAAGATRGAEINARYLRAKVIERPTNEKHSVHTLLHSPFLLLYPRHI